MEGLDLEREPTQVKFTSENLNLVTFLIEFYKFSLKGVRPPSHKAAYG